MRNRLSPLLHLALLAALAAACGDAGSGDGARDASLRNLPAVNDARTDLVLSWYGDGGPEVASKVADVPQEARREVRVQDPSIPPESRDPGVVFVADLTRANPDGSYPVREVERADYEKRQSRLKPAAAPRPATGTAAAGGAQVVMYATKTCPVCKNARRWLLDQGISYIEKDIEVDRAAAAELAQKGRAQGVPTSGVPIFEIRGRLLPGFDQGAIRAALSGAPPSKRIPLQPAPQATI